MSATAQDFIKWEAHAKTLDENSLRFIIKDCRDAEIAMRGWNVERENYYADQGFTYADALRRFLKKIELTSSF